MTLKDEFLEFVTENPRSDQVWATLPSGIDVEWSEKLKAWKVDMGIDVETFLSKNPDIKKSIARKHPKLNLNKLSTRNVVEIADDVLNELIKATDVGVPTAWIGHRTRSVRGGSASGANKSARYERAAESGKLTGITGSWEKAEGGGIVVRPSSRKDREFKNRQATLQGNRTYIDPDTGDEWGFEYKGAKSRANRTARRASERRNGSRERSQLAKEQKRRAQKAGLYVPLSKRDKELVQQLTNLTTDPNSPYYRYQVDHVYDMSLFDKSFDPRLLGNAPEALQLLSQKDNSQKFQEGKALSNKLAQMELTNPSRSMDPEFVQRAIGANRRLYSQAVKAAQAIPKPVLGLIPFVGMGFDAADAAERTQRAIKQPTLANKVQASISGVGAATTAAPNPVAQAVNFGAGLVNMGIDTARYVKQQLTSEEIMRAIGQIKPPTLFP